MVRAESAFDRFAANLVTSFTRIFHVCGLGRATELKSCSSPRN